MGGCHQGGFCCPVYQEESPLPFDLFSPKWTIPLKEGVHPADRTMTRPRGLGARFPRDVILWERGGKKKNGEKRAGNLTRDCTHSV